MLEGGGGERSAWLGVCLLGLWWWADVRWYISDNIF